MEGLNGLPDVQWLLSEARNRWLRPDEIFQVLKHPTLKISEEPPHQPCSGSVFFYDRRKTRYYKNDGIEWKKRRDGKKINGHSPLKVGDKYMLNCEYARGEKNCDFQRRCYSMLEYDLKHTVFVHYLDAKIPAERGSLYLSDGLTDPPLDPDSAYNWDHQSFEQRAQDPTTENVFESFYSVPDQQTQQLGLDNHHMQLASTESQHMSIANFDNSLFVEGNGKRTSVMKQSILNAEEGLEKVDSSSRCLGKKIAEVDDLNVGSSSAITWNTEARGNAVDDLSLSPSVSQDQLFSIIEFSPKWSYVDSETEVHIFGSFLKGHEERAKCNWSCMFGEVEVPAEVITDGVLCCRCPHHDVGRVPFYITNSNMLACSEVREFDYRAGPSEDINIIDIHHSPIEMHLHLRLERFLSVRSSCSSNSQFDGTMEKRKLISKILLLKEEGENYQMTEAASVEKLSGLAVTMQLVESQMKEKLFSWLLHKVAEGAKGPRVLDDDGQGVLHLAAALGFDWAIEPTVTAGVSINFRDVNGWAALHWAAFYGREQTVCVLVSLGATTGLLTDPSIECPLGKTPADLASENGHKGISGFLAESSATKFLKDLTVNDPTEDGLLDVSGTKAVQTIAERTASPVNYSAAQDELSPVNYSTAQDELSPVNYSAAQDELSLMDSLTGVSNATQIYGPRLDMVQLFLEAQHRWLRPAEICEVLRHYQKFPISKEPPNRPPSGSLFLFDRRVLRYFRKDGHNWRKKKDGKTVKEAHEKLKVGSADVLHCYYAHGQENENFQRRSYWMLEQELMYIVFVHYLEIKGNKTSSSPINNFFANTDKEPSRNTDSSSPKTFSSVCKDADSADSHQANCRRHLYSSPQIQNSAGMNNVKDGLWRSQQLSSSGVGTPSCTPADTLGNSSHMASGTESMGTWQEVFEQCSTGDIGLSSHLSTSPNHPVPLPIEGDTCMGQLVGGVGAEVNFDSSSLLQSNWQIPAERRSLHLSDGLPQPLLDPQTCEQWAQDLCTENVLESSYSLPDQQTRQLGLDNFHMPLASTESQHPSESNFDSSSFVEVNGKHTFVLKQSLLNAEGLKKVDSFSRWLSKELSEVDDLNIRSSSAITWNTEECGNTVDDSSLSPSLSQDQLFSIIKFSPKWSYVDSETEVHIIGSFLEGHEEMAKCNWSCMFGEVEVPAEVITDGVFCCRCPHHDVARVPFYITNSNRLACSEVREFDYRAGPSEQINIFDIHHSSNEMRLHSRLEKLFSFRSSSSSNSQFDGAMEKRKIISKILSLKEEGENHQMTEAASVEKLSGLAVTRQLVECQLKEKLFSWLLHKVAEGGRAPSVLDDDGQGVLHLAAALGFDWVIEPTVTAGVSINFRDVNGWTALHWAAFYGREQTVCVLVSLGAATGALTGPSPEFPLGRTPEDVASENGHKGISGYLTVNNARNDGLLDVSGTKAVQTSVERTASTVNYGAAQGKLSLKDLLTAVCDATQAATRICQVFGLQSFQRKQLAGSNDLDISDERALSLLVPSTCKSGHADGNDHAAAIQIQKMYRGWKKREEFLTIRETTVKSQADVREHQVRKQHEPIIWAVGILEKAILRWRRKGRGLRGFRRDALTREPNLQPLPPTEDAYDVLDAGRKQNEERMQHALTRVNSMIHYPEGRAQYRRLPTILEGFPESGTNFIVFFPPLTRSSFRSYFSHRYTSFHFH